MKSAGDDMLQQTVTSGAHLSCGLEQRFLAGAAIARIKAIEAAWRG